MPDVYIEDVIAPNYDELLDDVLDHRHSQYLLKGGRGSLKSSFIGFAIPLIMVQPGKRGLPMRSYSVRLPTPCAIPFTARWSLPLTSWALTANLSVMFPP